MVRSTNITWHDGQITKKNRQSLKGHKSAVLWFTGLSGAGKSTLSVAVEAALYQRGIHTYVLDGDNVRHGINKNLGFSPEDRTENIRRIGDVSKLMVDAGLMTLSAFISPYRNDREMVRYNFEENEFIEIYVKCSIHECENRDPKGLYKKAREGIIKEFTGISAPYEEPINPELTLETDRLTVEESVEIIINYLERTKMV
ncbi:adenylyl-sulfate kinase [Cohnella herbarum]|uniref:Adenylyl-sulfate kinase n=1 Tax=Cohnella herbarum TaxID=2728023 RepID=A0A7Z2VLI9_9BACL|nr:adenylyl-sulfate kinase [Cohnella herbarum]QJD85261.1 adenylyl-sulfate kinase [Cohnella herbarum]